jgi:Yip1 domain
LYRELSGIWQNIGVVCNPFLKRDDVAAMLKHWDLWGPLVCDSLAMQPHAFVYPNVVHMSSDGLPRTVPCEHDQGQDPSSREPFSEPHLHTMGSTRLAQLEVTNVSLQIFNLLLACILALQPKTDKELTFCIVFVVVIAGAVLLTVNVMLLGGSVSLLQSVSLLGYCMFPLDIAALIVVFVVRSESDHVPCHACLPVMHASGAALPHCPLPSSTHTPIPPQTPRNARCTV